MTARSSLVASAVLALFVFGCATAPDKKDPLAGLDLNARAFPHISLAVLRSENTKAAEAYMHQGEVMGSVDADKVHQRYLAMFANFKGGVEITKFEDVNTTAADVVVLLDTRTVVKAMGHVTSETTLTFYSRTRDVLDTVHAEASADGHLFSYKDAVHKAIGESLDALETNLRASQPLAQLDRMIAARDLAAQPAVAAAPLFAPAPTPQPAVAPSSSQLSGGDLPPFALPERPDDVALVIGVERYANVVAAPDAERDAQAMAGYFRALGVPERNLIVLTGEKAVRSSLAKYLEAWLPRNVRPSSRVFIYFSGHGAPDPSTGNAYLVPWDGDPKFLEETAYSLDRLEQTLGALPAERVLVMLDACFSGSGGRSVLPAGVRPLVTVRRAGRVPPKVTLLSAASAEEITGLSPQGDHGLFTHHLLDGLSGRAAEPNGRITVQDLFGYLRPRVQDDARRENREQIPELVGEHADGWDLRPAAR